jgi:DNA-binding GntR family transcriptional regulator
MAAEKDRTRHHEILAEAIRNRIRSGVYPVGRLLPSTAGLQEMFGMSASTVYKATAQLAREGVIITHQGSGTVVRAIPPTPQPDLSDELAEIDAALGALHRRVQQLRDRVDTHPPSNPRDH